MSNRYGEPYKGSSRSTRDDSRTPKQYSDNRRDVRGTKYSQSRSRSRSPHKQDSPSPRSGAYSPDRPGKSSSSRYRDDRREKSNQILSSNDWEDSEEDVPPPPPPPRITKVTMGFKEPIKMTLSGGTKPAVNIPKPTVASVFNDDDDDEPEEMPAEAKMRMRNIGRETPTSAGPNSFGKTKQGFCDAKKVFEKNLKQALETNPTDKPMKFPQTIYKIKGP